MVHTIDLETKTLNAISSRRSDFAHFDHESHAPNCGDVRVLRVRNGFAVGAKEQQVVNVHLVTNTVHDWKVLMHIII